MTIALEIGAAFLLAATLLAGATFLAALQLGRLATCDDEQREVEIKPAGGVVGNLARCPEHRVDSGSSDGGNDHHLQIRHRDRRGSCYPDLRFHPPESARVAP